MSEIEIKPYPDNLLMNWPRLLSPIGFGGIAHRHDDEHLSDFEDFQIQNMPEYLALGGRMQTFPLDQKTYDSNHGLGGLMTTRLTHSQLVARIGEMNGRTVGRSITRRLAASGNMQNTPFGVIRTQHFGLIPKVASPPHDMGSPPFAHQGENALREWTAQSWVQTMLKYQLTKSQMLDWLNFDANANAWGILAEKKIFTFPVMATIAKYPYGSGSAKFGFFSKDADDFEIMAEALGMIKEDKETKQTRYMRHPLVYLLEAADDIAYLFSDFRDAAKKNLYGLEMKRDPNELTGAIEEIEAADSIEQILYYVTGKYFDKSLEKHKRSYASANEKLSQMEAAALRVCVAAVSEAFLKHEDAILNGENLFSLINLAILPNGKPFRPIHEAIRKNFFSTVIKPINVETAWTKDVVKDMLDIFCMSYFTLNSISPYETKAGHQDSRDEKEIVKKFLNILQRHDHQDVARFSFDQKLNDFLQDALRWLCQQGDQEITRTWKQVKKTPRIEESLTRFKAKFPATGKNPVVPQTLTTLTF